MPSLKEIKENLSLVSTVKNIVSAYHEIANLRMKQVREKVLKNREFFAQLLDVYQKIKSAYVPVKRKIKKFPETKMIKKERVVIFLSANHLFYGSLISEIWKKTIAYLKEQGDDLVVVGKIGRYLAEAAGFGNQMFYFDLNDEKPEEKNIMEIIEFIKNYKKITVFYGWYKTVLSQVPVSSKISESIPEKIGLETKKYLFEPSPEEVLEFFEKEIIATLFNQCILQHQLARYAARAIAMYQATENAKILEKKLNQTEKKLRKQILSKKQIGLFSYFKNL